MMQRDRAPLGDADAPAPPPGPDGARSIRVAVFDTDVELAAYPDDGEDPADPGVASRLGRALAAARDRCLFFERTLSRTRPDSDISRAHAASPDPVPVAGETAELVRLAQGYCARSGGLFDITMGTVTSLWDFHRGVVPERGDIRRALAHVGMDRVSVGTGPQGPTLRISDPGTVLDLGGVAKGYIADDLADLMASLGARRVVLDLGGNLLVRGGRPPAEPGGRGGAPWRVGIVNPLDPAHHRAIVDVADGSVVTSGLHERSFTRGGVLYHHILDPATGMPVQTDVRGATIVARRSLDCDGWSTTALMMGAERARDFIEGIDGVEAVIIDDADEVRWTTGVAERLMLVPTLPRL